MNPNISLLIVDDDINKIYNIINTIKEVTDVNLNINQALNISEAIDLLKDNKYHLLISDLLMPYFEGDKILENGGEILVSEVYKTRKKLNVPLYILGLTQHKEHVKKFNKIWNVVLYDPKIEDWREYLRDLIFHINLIKANLSQNLSETIFVEGINDKKILEKTLDVYFKDFRGLFGIECVKFGGGTDWVERKILIWCKSLNKKNETVYLKAVGLFDNDGKGLQAISNINNIIKPGSAESKTYSIIKTSTKYSSLLKSLKLKNVLFHTTMEDLIGIETWRAAFNNGWLEKRTLQSYIGSEFSELNEHLLTEVGCNADEILIALYRVKDEFKTNFTNLAIENEDLSFVSYLLSDCLEKLKLK